MKEFSNSFTKGYSEVAKITGLNRESLYRTFNGKVKPRWETIHKVLKAVNVKLEIAA